MSDAIRIEPLAGSSGGNLATIELPTSTSSPMAAAPAVAAALEYIGTRVVLRPVGLLQNGAGLVASTESKSSSSGVGESRGEITREGARSPAIAASVTRSEEPAGAPARANQLVSSASPPGGGLHPGLVFYDDGAKRPFRRMHALCMRGACMTFIPVCMRKSRLHASPALHRAGARATLWA